MIKIYKYGEVENNEIFSRMADTVDVSDIVTDIIENVKANGDKALLSTAKNLTRLHSLLSKLTKKKSKKLSTQLNLNF